MNKCTELRKYAFPDPFLLDCFIVLVDSTSQNIRHFLTLCIYRVLKNNVYNVSGMIEEVKTNIFLFGKTLAYAPFCR